MFKNILRRERKKSRRKKYSYKIVRLKVDFIISWKEVVQCQKKTTERDIRKEVDV